jgi:hypothetical protein
MTTPTTETTLLEKIALLLRKAESTDSEAEAEALTAKAQQLATLHQIEIEQARRWVPKNERREAPVTEYIKIGAERTWGLPQYCDLFMYIGGANDLKFRIYTNYTAVVAIGFPSDIETVKVLYASLLVQMVDACNRYLATDEWRSEKVYRQGTKTNSWGGKYKDWGYFPATNRQARTSFMAAYARRVGTRLDLARQEAVEEAKATEAAAARSAEVSQVAAEGSGALHTWDEPYMDLDGIFEPSEAPEGSGVALVLAAKHDEVQHFYDAKYGKSDRRSGGSSWASKANTSVGGARKAGVQAANAARLTPAKSLGGSRGSLGS